MSIPTRIGQEAPDLKTPSSPSRITPTRALDDAEHQMTKSEPPAPKYPYAVDEAGVARVGYVAVDPAQHNKATELQLWPLFGTKLTFAIGINIRGAGSLFRNDMDSTIERRARGDDDDESFHTASALTPSSMASLPA